MTPLEKMLVEHEGLCLDLYRDTASPPRWTIGTATQLAMTRFSRPPKRSNQTEQPAERSQEPKPVSR